MINHEYAFNAEERMADQYLNIAMYFFIHLMINIYK